MRRINRVSCGVIFVASLSALLGAAPATRPYHGAFVEVAPTDVRPGGWVAEMLHRQVEGLAKHHAVSGYPFDTCLWTGIIPKGGSNASWKPWWPYEQTAYLVDGLERLGLMTGDPTVSGEAEANIKYVLEHQAADGTLGPTHIGPTNWPEAVMSRAMMAEYAATMDPAIPEALRKHYLGRPADYGKNRDACNVEAILWAYGKTGDEALLKVAERTYDNFNLGKPKSGLAALASDARIVEHGVTFNETAKLPAILYMYTGERRMLDASVNAYRKVDRDHMMASGMHTAQESLDGKDPWKYTETCDVTDYTWSVGYLLMATGDATWADHVEKAVFNAGLGAITKDFKSHQYFSAPNQVVAAPGVCRRLSADRLAYRPGHEVECCTGNVERFLPNFAMRQWMRTADGGVVAAMYGPSKLTTKIEGAAVSIDEQTQYPFSETVTFVVHTDKPVAFPFEVRIPGWTTGASLSINGKPEAITAPGTFATVNRTFADGDTLELKLPMTVKIADDAAGHASVERGPLVYSLQIAEKATPITADKATAEFPAWDKRPASPWNYALDLGAGGGAGQVKVVMKEATKNAAACPWDEGASPVMLQVPARRITNWGLAADGGNPGFPKAAELAEGTETVTLVPYGSTCLRLTVFPITGANGR